MSQDQVITKSKNSKLMASLNIGQQDNTANELSIKMVEPKSDSMIEELKAMKKASKKPSRVACSTHLLPETNVMIEKLVEKTGVSKSQILEQLILKSLSK